MSTFISFYSAPSLHTRWELTSIYFPGKSQSYGFFYSHIWMWKLHHKETSCWRTDAFKLLEKTLESPSDCKEIKPINPKGKQPWIFIGRTDAEAETLILWPLHMKSRLIGKGPDAGKDWGKEKGAPEDEMVGWHHWLDGHEFEQTPGDSEGQGSLVYCSPWGCKELDKT